MEQNTSGGVLSAKGPVLSFPGVMWNLAQTYRSTPPDSASNPRMFSPGPAGVSQSMSETKSPGRAARAALARMPWKHRNMKLKGRSQSSNRLLAVRKGGGMSTLLVNGSYALVA